MATAPLSVKKVNVKNMNKLIDFLKELDESKFNFDFVIHEVDNTGCGTVCCAVGWFPKIFSEVTWGGAGGLSMDGDNWCEYEDVAAKIMNLDCYLTRRLFEPSGQIQVHNYLTKLGPKCTPFEVAKMLEHFMELVKDGEIAGHEV